MAERSDTVPERSDTVQRASSILEMNATEDLMECSEELREVIAQINIRNKNENRELLEELSIELRDTPKLNSIVENSKTK